MLLFCPLFKLQLSPSPNLGLSFQFFTLSLSLLSFPFHFFLPFLLFFLSLLLYSPLGFPLFCLVCSSELLSLSAFLLLLLSCPFSLLFSNSFLLDLGLPFFFDFVYYFFVSFNFFNVQWFYLLVVIYNLMPWPFLFFHRVVDIESVVWFVVGMVWVSKCYILQVVQVLLVAT